MAADIKILPVPWRGQERGFFCGPACLQMVLEFLGNPRTQQQLFDEVIAHSTGARPPEAPCDPNHACYSTQVCDLCGDWECWDTDPEALTATLNDRVASVRYRLHYVRTAETGTDLIIETIRRARAVPPVTTVQAFNHWIVVNGYHLERARGIASADPNVHPAVKGLYIRNPLDRNQRAGRVRRPRQRLVSILEWNERFVSLDCGPHLDEYVVIAGTRGRSRRRGRRRPRVKRRRTRK